MAAPGQPTDTTAALSIRRQSVVVYLVAAFGACIVMLVALLATTAASTLNRERRSVATELRSVAQTNAQSFTTSIPSVTSILQSLQSQPALASLNPAACDLALAGLASVTSQAHLHVVRANGSIVCSLQDSALKGTYAAGPWLSQALRATQPLVLPVGMDALSQQPAITAAAPIAGPSGAVGAVIVVAYTGTPALSLPPDAPKGMVIVTVDAGRQLVLATSPGAPVRLGADLSGGPLSRPVPGHGHSIVDADGKRRVYEDVPVDGLGWHVLVGVPTAVAFAAANADLRRNELLALLTILLVGALGVLLHRRLARPLRKVWRAIEASRAGGDAVRAPLAGPSEVARVAVAFNELIVERAARERDLYDHARRDELTGLPNRRCLNEHIDGLLARQGDSERLAVLFLDLDRFKNINDAYGHATGDHLLDALGSRLSQIVGARGLVGRFGGDEFVAVCHPVTTAEAVGVAQAMASALADPFDIDSHELFVTGSVGIAFAHAGNTAVDLLRDADTAMYRAKERGRGGFALFDAAMRDWTVRRLHTEQDLHRALQREEFELYYQPKIVTSDGTLVGFEALLRWHHPERGIVAPGEFIQIAEETGLILPIGEWVMREALEQSARWRRQGHRTVPIAINVAPRQLDASDFPGVVEHALSAAGAPPTSLAVEITESVIVDDPELVAERLARLRGLGVAVSIDDFGMGYSSLSYLQRLPFDELKIDRSFVASISQREPTPMIVKSIVDLGHALGVRTVAEGVELPGQLDRLKDMGCDLAQGYCIGRPEPAGRAERFLGSVSVIARH